MALLRDRHKSIFQAYILLPLCTLLALHPIFHWGFPQGHDLVLELTRVSEYAHLLRAGDFPVRWGTDLEGGHGYPIYNFFPPLFSLLTSVFIILCGVPVVTSIKLAVLVFALAGGYGMYLFARKYFEKDSASLVACLYILAPYHFIDVFVRNAFSEFTAASIAPFVFYSLARILKTPHNDSAAQTTLTISSALLILSHNLSVVMYLPLLFCYFLVAAASSGDWKKWRQIIAPLTLSFLLTSFYTLPVLLEHRFVQIWMLTSGQHFDVLQNLKSVSQLMGHWLTPFSGALILLSLLLAIITRRKMPPNDFAIFAFFAVALLCALLMVTPASRFVWERIDFLRLFQFPWRLLSPATLLICFLPGILNYLTGERVKKMLAYGLILLAMLTITTLSMVLPRHYLEARDGELSPGAIRTQWLRTTVFSEYLPIWASAIPEIPVEDRLTLSTPNSTISKINDGPNRYSYDIEVSERTLATAKLFFFPGWNVYANNEELHTFPSAQGLIQFYLSPGKFQVDVKFENTPVRTTGNILSLLGLPLLALQVWMTFRQRVPAKKPCL